jgi:hypothetical protein
MQEHHFEPMSIGRIIDRSFRIYRVNFIRFITIAAIILVPISLLQLVGGSLVSQGIPSQRHLITRSAAKNAEVSDADRSESEPSRYQESRERESPSFGAGAFAGISVTLLAVFLMVLGNSLVNAALTKSVSASYLGSEVSVGEAYQAVIPKILTLIGAGILVGLVVMCGYLLLIVPGVIFGLWFSLTTPTIIVENCKVVDAMKRSKALTKGNLGKVFGVLFIAGIITNIIIYLFAFVGGFLGPMVAGGSTVVVQIFQEVFTFIGQVLGIPIMAAAAILLYYDLRIRKEGFDLEMMAQSLSLESASPLANSTANEQKDSQEQTNDSGQNS